MSIEIEESQTEFLQRGGTFRMALAAKRKLPPHHPEHLSREYQFAEYPKALTFNLGRRKTDFQTETCKGAVLKWTEEREATITLIVQGFAEEEETHEMFERALELGLEIEPHWTLGLLREMVSRRDRAVAARASRTDPVVIVDKASRVAALQAELAALTGVAMGPGEAPLVAGAGRRSHRRKQPAVSPALGQAPPGVDHAA
jgi:hypothetical protein